MYARVGVTLGGVLLAFILTALTIDATDTISGKGGTLLAQLAGVEAAVCPEGMIHIKAGVTFTCIDEFEASAASSCLKATPQNEFDTEINLSQSTCAAVSEKDTLPWRFVTREQAAILCTRAGKRLPLATEWYQAILGTPTEACNIETGSIAPGGSAEACVSAAGVRDGVGNVWEWVADDVIQGMYAARELPATGYVTQVDSGGVATVTNEEKGELAGDYFWMQKEGAYGMIRGGFYGSKNDAGTHTVHAQTLPTFSGAAVGFRCVR